MSGKIGYSRSRRRDFCVTPSARKRLPQRKHRTPRRLRPQPGPEWLEPVRIAATIPDELAARVPGYSADRGDFRRRGPNRVFEEGRSPPWTADARWSRGGPRSGPPSALRDAHTMSQRDHTGPREGKRRAEKPAIFSFSIRVSANSSPWPPWLIVCLPLRIPGNGHQLRDSSRRLLTPRKSGPAIITHSS